jgi:glycerophosphoryl diester phosphodiesterase
VLDAADGRLVLSHSDPPAGAELATLDEALELLRGADGVLLHLDLKRAGYEAGVVEAVRRHGVEERAYASTFFGDSLRELRRLAPELRRAISYPNDRLGVGRRRPLRPAVAAGAALARRTLPLRIGRWLARTGASAATLHHALVSPAVVESCHAAGAAVLAWTVNDPVLAERLMSTGVDGIITDDPRILRLPSTT